MIKDSSTIVIVVVVVIVLNVLVCVFVVVLVVLLLCREIEGWKLSSWRRGDQETKSSRDRDREIEIERSRERAIESERYGGSLHAPSENCPRFDVFDFYSHDYIDVSIQSIYSNTLQIGRCRKGLAAKMLRP